MTAEKSHARERMELGVMTEELRLANIKTVEVAQALINEVGKIQRLRAGIRELITMYAGHTWVLSPENPKHPANALQTLLDEADT